MSFRVLAPEPNMKWTHTEPRGFPQTHTWTRQLWHNQTLCYLMKVSSSIILSADTHPGLLLLWLKLHGHNPQNLRMRTEPDLDWPDETGFSEDLQSISVSVGLPVSLLSVFMKLQDPKIWRKQQFVAFSVQHTCWNHVCSFIWTHAETMFVVLY